MKKNPILRSLVAGALAVSCAFGMTACAPDTSKTEDNVEGLTGGVAATVNGVEIEEDDITRAIANMRASYNLEEEDQWKQYLSMYGNTVESMRYEIIGQFVDRELVLQCANQLGVTTDDAEIQSYVEKMSSQYSSEEAWLDAVEKAGWESEDKYHESLRYSILDKKIKDGMREEQEAAMDDAALLTTVQEKVSTYDGAKRSAHIQFANTDQETANQVLEQLRNGQLSWNDAVAQYSTDEDTKGNGGDMGWDKIAELESDYTTALANVEKDAYSEVTSVKNNYDIITVTDVWTAPENVTSTSQLPDEFVADIRTKAIDEKVNDSYDQWLADRHADNDVQVNPMPENVPYWVDMSDSYSEEEMAKTNEKALKKLTTGIEEEEEEATEAEATADAAAAAEGEAEGGTNEGFAEGNTEGGDNGGNGDTGNADNASNEGDAQAENSSSASTN